MSENLSSKIGTQEKPVNKTGLPLDYGDTKITILPRDPICIFAYWSISDIITPSFRVYDYICIIL